MKGLSRRDWILLCLREKPLDRIRLMKALFLIWHRSGRSIPGFFDFVPYLYGPCSFDLYRELEAAEREQLVSQAPHQVAKWAPYFLTKKGEQVAARALENARPDTLRLLRSVVAEVAAAGFYDLLREVYAEAPDFASQSLVAPALRS